MLCEAHSLQGAGALSPSPNVEKEGFPWSNTEGLFMPLCKGTHRTFVRCLLGKCKRGETGWLAAPMRKLMRDGGPGGWYFRCE